ncbi:MAG: hypothetical protein HUJ26_14895 [Planctomycetaceae bacterium]|nr:hypothetical protein [Planctomycetaceae bacterium]
MRCAPCLFLLLSLMIAPATAEDTIFSGPQPGEKLPGFTVKGVFGEHAGKEFDPIQIAGEKPVLIIFVHARTRPAFGLTNAVMKYAAQRKKDGLTSIMVWLTADATETEKWLKVVEKHMPDGVEIGYSPDGIEGPGAYGLNRNVTMTVLVGKENKTTANFALVQPSLQADGPLILKEIVAAVGSGEVPDISELGGPRYRAMQRPNSKTDTVPNMRPVLSPLLNKEASKDEIDAAAKKVEEFAKNNPAAAKELGRITNTIINAGKLENYGTSVTQEYFKKWATKYKDANLNERARPNGQRTGEKKPEEKSER